MGDKAETREGWRALKHFHKGGCKDTEPSQKGRDVLPVSWALSSSTGLGETLQSCGGHASLPTCFLGWNSEGSRLQAPKLSQDAG